MTAGVIVHMTRQQEEKEGEKEEEDNVLTVTVRENAPAGTVVANLTTLQLQNRGRGGADHLIANQDAREKFVLTDASLLVTSGPLDREERESYMVTIVLGRKGLIRGRQAVQVKVGNTASCCDTENSFSALFWIQLVHVYLVSLSTCIRKIKFVSFLVEPCVCQCQIHISKPNTLWI